MADRLAGIFGTEKDKVNCPFYFKIGACRHGDQCSRQHNKPTISETLLLKNMYQNPSALIARADGSALEADDKEGQQHFEDFYEDVFYELSKFGQVDMIQICDNIGDHLVGNVYVKFADEDSAEKALKGLNGRFYAGRPIVAEFSPVTDFKEARCRQFDSKDCSRGGYCNFMHLKQIGRDLQKKLFGNNYGRRDGRRSRSRSPGQDRRGRDDRDRRDHRSDRDRDSHRRDDRDRGRDDRRDDRDRRDRDRDSRRDDRDRRGDDRDRRGEQPSAGVPMPQTYQPVAPPHVTPNMMPQHPGAPPTPGYPPQPYVPQMPGSAPADQSWMLAGAPPSGGHPYQQQ